MEITVDTSQVIRLVDLWNKSPDIVREESLRTVTEIDILIQGELMQALPRGAGGKHGAGLAGSITHSEQALDDGVIGMVATAQPYAEYLETGTRPYKVGKLPPIQPIADWVEAVLGLKTETVTSKKSHKKYLGGEGGAAAFAIAKSIAKKGMKKQPVWQQTYTKALPKIQQKLEACIDRITARLAGGAA